MRRYALLLLTLLCLGLTPARAQDLDLSKKEKPSISILPSPLEFGEVLLGESVQRTVTIVSDGKDEAELEVLRLAGDGDFALQEDRCTGRDLVPGERCELLIAFTPAETGKRAAELRVIDDDDELLGRLSMTGWGVAPVPSQPLMVVASPLNFGELAVGLQVEKALLVYNEGNAPLVLGQIGRSVPLSAPFALTGDLCSGQTLAPGGNCSLRITFTAATAGSYEQEFDIPSNDPQRNPALVRLQGVAVVPPPAPLPHIRVRDSSPPNDDRHIDFGQVTVGARVEATVTVRNEGDAPLEIGPLRDYPLAAPFSVTRDDCSGKRLNAGKECQIRLLFNPLNAGAFAEGLAIPSNDPDGLVTVSLVGSATASPEARLQVVDSLPPVDDLNLPFSTVSIGHVVEQAVTLRNTGNAPLRLGAIAAAQSLVSPFALPADPCSNRTLQPQEVCVLPVTFAPTAAGSFNDSFDIPSNAGQPVIFKVSGTGTETALPRISISDSLPPADDHRLDFAEVTVGRTVEATVTVTNSGTADLRIAQIAALRAPFGMTADQCSQKTLQVGESCLLLVTFAPLSSTLFQGELTIPSNDAGQPQVRLPLIGRGLPAGVNQPPSPPRLLSPGAGQQDLGLLVTLRWEQSSDPDGDPIRYRVRWASDSSFAGGEEELLTSAGTQGFRADVLLLAGLCGAGALRRRGRLGSLMILAVLLLTTLSCSSGTGEGVGVVSLPLKELQPASTYYWQVIAEDGRGGSAESEIRSFSTARR
jgi:hypothetical protein